MTDDGIQGPDPALSGPATCPRCRLALEPRQKFCDGCGLELVQLAAPAQPVAPDPALPAPPKRKRTRRATPPPAPVPPAEGATHYLPDAPVPPPDADAPPNRKRTRRAPRPPAESGLEPATRFLPDVPRPAPAPSAPAMTRPLDALPPVPAPKPRRPRRTRRAAASPPAPAPPHILPQTARGMARRGCLPAPALLVLLVVGIIGLSQVAYGLFDPAPDSGPAPTATRTPRFQVQPPTRRPRLPPASPMVDGAVSNLDIVASASYRDRAGTLCLVGVIGNDLDLGLGVEVTAALVDAAGTTLAKARSRYYPSGLLTPGVRLPFRMELAHPPSAWSDIQWDLSTFDVSGEAETVYHDLQVVDTVLRPPAARADPWTLTGQIANTGARAARSLRLYAAVYDAAGALLDANEVDGPPDPLAPGAQTPFTIVLPRPDMQPIRAEVVVEGH